MGSRFGFCVGASKKWSQLTAKKVESTNGQKSAVTKSAVTHGRQLLSLRTDGPGSPISCLMGVGATAAWLLVPCNLRGANSLCSHEPTGGCDRHAFLVSTSAMPWSWIASKMNSWQVRDIINYGLYAW